MKNVLECLDKDYGTALGESKLFRKWAKETGDDEAKYLNWKYAFQNLSVAKEFKKAMQILSAPQYGKMAFQLGIGHGQKPVILSCKGLLQQMVNENKTAIAATSNRDEIQDYISDNDAILYVIKLIDERMPL